MSGLPPLIADLAWILTCAGIVTLLFKRLKQPAVLGYIVAGFISNPHFLFTSLVVDLSNIHIWADIGVIFLLFALGLEFSFKKLVKVGGTAFIAALTIIIGMSTMGWLAAKSFGWSYMDCAFLGGMLAMSSTTIIYKSFADLKLKKHYFAGVVMSILIVEDILAILLMVLLSTLAVSNHFEGMEMVGSIVKLLFFLIIWFVVGIFLIPSFLKKCRKWLNEETLLIVALALCFLMVIFAGKVGFSAAFGAFVMGSILSETIESEKIIELIRPLKDLFGAIFFVSVGMMVDPQVVVTYISPIFIITLVVILGQSFLGTLGVLLAGKELSVAVKSGFSLVQIGEFAFIIASLGVSLGVTSSFLYPIVVVVSVLTTFITPYMIRFAPFCVTWLEKNLPASFIAFLNRYSVGTTTVNSENNWHKLLLSILRISLVYTVLSVAIILLSLDFFLPFLREHLQEGWAASIGAIVTVVLMSPFLRALIMKKNRSEEFTTLWKEGRFNRASLVSTIFFRSIIAIGLVFFLLAKIFHFSLALIILIAFLLVGAIVYSKRLKKHSILLERRFYYNLRFKDLQYNRLILEKPNYFKSLLSRDLHLADYNIPSNSVWTGESLHSLRLSQRYGVYITSLLRGDQRINIPSADVVLFPHDRIQVIGTDKQLEIFDEAMHTVVKNGNDTANVDQSEMCLRRFVVSEQSAIAGKVLADSGIKSKYNCLVVGIERGDNLIKRANLNAALLTGDVVWVVGEIKSIYNLIDTEVLNKK